LRQKLSPERIAELDRFQMQKTFELIRFGMRAGVIPFSNKIVIRRMVRKHKSEIAQPEAK
jgi:hypothetical protein